MLHTALNFLIHTIFDILTFVLLLRFFMQLLKAPFQNPLAQMAIALTDFMVKPARRWIPSYKKIDLSTLVLAFLVQVLLQLILLSLRGFPFAVAGGAVWFNLMLIALLGLVRMSLDLFFYAILIQAVLSWVNPHTPITGVLNALTRPILAPIQRWIPPVNGIDFSALVAMILLQMVNIAFISYAQQSLNAVF